MNQNPIVTFTTEYGLNSPYSAVLKGKLCSVLPQVQLVDISHEVLPNDIMAAAYLIHCALTAFPAGTIHVVAVDFNLQSYPSVLIAKYNDQYIIGSDNGFFSLLFKNKQPEIFALSKTDLTASSVFQEPEIFTTIVSHLAQGKHMTEIASSTTIQTIRETLTPSIVNNMLKGSIVFIDGYQNIITDITRKEFDAMLIKWPKFEILYRRKGGIKTISTNYVDEKDGEVLALFNSFGFLEIAIPNGNAKSLLGLKVGGNIIIEFND